MKIAVDPYALRYRDELVRYGVGYADSCDFLYVGKRFMEEPDLADLCVAGTCPSLAVELLREPYGPEHVGVKFNGTRGLVRLLWNGVLPSPCPISFAADLADACLYDPQSYLQANQRHRLAEAEEMHRRARQFTEELGVLPSVILDRLQEKTRKNKRAIN